MRLKVGPKSSVLLLAITALLLAVGPFKAIQAVGGTMTNRYVKLSDDVATRTNVTYEIGFDTTIDGTLGSVEIEFCDNDPFPGTSCTVPTGLNVSQAVLLAQSGTNDFAVDLTQINAHTLVLSRTPSFVTATSFKFELNNITNPSNTGTVYARLRTFSGSGTGGSVTDSSGLAISIDGDISISTQVPPHLDFCVGVTIPSNDCSSVIGDIIDFGVLTTSNTKAATSQFEGATNAINGYSVTINGNSLTSGNNVLSALNSLTVSQPGTNQFGMNLRSNVMPLIGAESTGSGTASAAGNYAVSDNFIFKNGDIIVSASTPSDFQKFTASYIVNISRGQPAGYYSTTLTFIATGNF